MSDEPNTWAWATVRNDWGETLSNVQLFHRYDNDHKDDQSWASLEAGQQGEKFRVGYWTGFLRTGKDYWLISFEAGGKKWTCKDNFYCFLTGDDANGTVVCRVYQEGGEGKMEVVCPQSSGAKVSLSSQASAKTATCDGTLVPGGRERLHKAILDEDKIAVYRRLQQADRDPAAVERMEAEYFNTYHSRLDDDLREHFSKEEEQEYALQLINRGKPGTKQIIKGLPNSPAAISDAVERIREAVQGGGTDEEAVYAALFPFKRHTTLLQQAYYDRYQEDLRERIVGEMSGSELSYGFELLETRYQYYLQEANEKLMRIPFPGPDDFSKEDPPGEHIIQYADGSRKRVYWYDKDYWEGDSIPMEDEDSPDPKAPELGAWIFRLRPSQSPTKAFDALVDKQSKWKIACAEYVQLLHLYALRHVFSPAWFEKRVGPQPVIQRRQSSGVVTVAYFRRRLPTEQMVDAVTGSVDPRSVAQIVAEAPAGSRVRWTSLRARAYPGNPWSNENTTKLGPNKFAAHGTEGFLRSNINKADEVAEEVGKQAADLLKRDPNLNEAQRRYDMQNDVFISQIEIFEDPSENAVPLL